MSEITDEQKAEFRAVRADAASLIARLNAILVETGRDYRAHLEFRHITPHWLADDGDALEDYALEDDDNALDDGDALALDRPRGRIGSELGEREDESDPPSADDGEGA